MMLLLALLHSGGDRMDFIYFLSSLLIVALPLGIFGALTYLVWRGSRKAKASSRTR